MTAIQFSVENIDSIDPGVAPSYGTRSLSVECRMTDDQMLALLTLIQQELPAVKWEAWLNEEV